MFLRKDRGTYATELRLPGYGQLRRVSLHTDRAADARAIEAAIIEVARRALHEPRLHRLLDALQDRTQPLAAPDLLVALRSPHGPDEGLARLLRSIDDPPLADAIASYLASGPGVTREDALAAPRILSVLPGARLSDLADPDTVARVLRQVRGSRRAASVRRYEGTFISKVLTWRYGRAERDRVLADVRMPTGDDRRSLREAVVTPVALRNLCEALDARALHPGDEAASLYVRLAATTGAEVRPLSECRVSDWTRAGSGGRLLIRGTKRAKRGGGNRDREVTVPSVLTPLVDAHAVTNGRQRPAVETLFPLAYSRFWTLFGKARKDAGLLEAVLDGDNRPTPLRPHDLRRAFALLAGRAGLRREVIGLAGLGHDDLSTTDRYSRAQVTVSGAEADAVAVEAGLN